MVLMSLPRFASAPWAKSKVDLYTLSADGKHFYGQMQHPGHALLMSNSKVIHHSMMFLSCMDRGCFQWSPCAISATPFHHFKAGDSIKCQLALMVGVVYNPDDDSLYCHFLQWRYDLGVFSNITEAFSHYTHNNSMIKELFESKVTMVNVNEINIRFLSQVCGPTICCRQGSPTLAIRDGLTYHEMSSSPDRWSVSWLPSVGKESYIIAPVKSSNIADLCHFSKHNSKIARICKTTRLLQYKSSKTMVVFCRLRLRPSTFGVYKWVPMPTSKPGYQDYALLYPSQLISVQEWLMKFDQSLIHPEELVIELSDIMHLSGTPIMSFPILRCGASYLGNNIHNLIVVCVNHEADPETVGAMRMSPSHWCMFLDVNCNDCEVPGCGMDAFGVVVGRFGTYPRKTPLSRGHMKLLNETYPSSGLSRHCTEHEGKFYMCHFRHSDMSNSNMAQVSSPSQHFYFDERKMYVSLLNFSQPILNSIANEAIQHRDSVGQVQTLCQYGTC